METTSAKDAMEELTMILLYLSRFTQKGRFSVPGVWRAWKGYDFDTLDQLDNADYIRQSNPPSRLKSVYLTEAGMEKARELMQKYGIEDWN